MGTCQNKATGTGKPYQTQKSCAWCAHVEDKQRKADGTAKQNTKSMHYCEECDVVLCRPGTDDRKCWENHVKYGAPRADERVAKRLDKYYAAVEASEGKGKDAA